MVTTDHQASVDPIRIRDLVDQPGPRSTPTPEDNEAGRALLRILGDQVVARLAKPGTLFRITTTA